ncbi:MAG: MMPL family transporter [Steroidobacteraceae bacterium]
MTRAGATATLVWAVFIAVAAAIVARAHYTTDLSAFLPRTPTAAQRLLVDQLREGIASRLILIGIEGADPPTRARISLAMGRRLRADRQFLSVNNGEPVGLDRDRELLFSHRYVLSAAVTPGRFTATGLRDAIQESLELLASPAGLLVKSLLPRDPTGEMLQIIDQLGNAKRPPTVDGAWASRDGKRALLVAQTRAAGSDTDGQQRAVETIRRAFAEAAGTAKASLEHAANARLEMSGPGVFSVAARSTIKHEVVRLSILSTVLILLMLLVVYRSLLALVLGFMPVASGALAGVAAVALGFGLVHGITLGFGVTLIGESIDYSIYLFIQSPQRSLWPTIGLGVLTSIAGFASLLPSGFPGLAQLGLYSISGLVVAACVTRFVLPHWMPARLRIRDTTLLGAMVASGLKRVRMPRAVLVVVPILAAVVLYVHRGSVWNRELSALSPVSAADQALDGLLRADIGAPDVRDLVVVSGPDPESVLRTAEKVDKQLDALADAGIIGGYESPARYLPSLATQRARQASLPDPARLRNQLQSALDGLPLRPERLEPFVHDVETARTQPLVTRADLEGTSLAAGVDALLLKDGPRWSALLPLRTPTSVAIDVGRVHSAVSQAAPGKAVVLDVKAEADLLYSTYLSEVVRLSLAGFCAIVVLLLLALRSAMRVLRVVAPLALAVMTVAAGLVLAGRQLTILHLIGMLLIVAVGSNYALFFDRRANDRHAGEVPLTLASLVIANAATVVGFGVLASSSVPVLAALGSTVAPGALLALLFSALLARELPVVT